ncbi:Zn(II)2Cys6 transcription factor domain-containing protein [Aspergillus mulundensis]|uniref:Zn(2)-C6 fungal-type domain-containing protein n=1 Tax=Aspergillus mulundensis TaxID=1810919 RepID=A0A3D8RYP3_9EURO|nr:Uncharacterized protein DSM5745_05980 [Aspergillus mulundensis]RDW79128.1 Uncharacterized protein DSM5745_05980 [Aspergillus mulundensis]
MLRPRKTHTKSRYGCDNCRRRRVKCDEIGPPCTNCVLRRLDNCIYSRVLPASLMGDAGGRRASTPSSTSYTSSNQSLPALTTPIPPLKPSVDELELMHQFTAETYQSLCVNENEIRTWQVLVPRLALKHRYLMHGILALASLQIATTREPPDAALAYIDAGLEYHSLSLEPFRIAIGNLTPENCDAALAQSVVTTAISLALPQVTAARELQRENRDTQAQPQAQPQARSGLSMSVTDNILTVFELLQGVKKIFYFGKRQAWINLGLFSKGEFWRKDCVTKLDPDTDGALEKLADLNATLQHPNDGGGAGRGSVNPDVIAHLRHCFMKFACSPDPAPVLAWLAAVDVGFVESLRRRERLAMLVLAYWGILLGELDGQEHRWWARNSGRVLVGEVLGGLPGLGVGLGPGVGTRTGTENELEARGWGDCLAWVRRRVGDIPRPRTGGEDGDGRLRMLFQAGIYVPPPIS